MAQKRNAEQKLLKIIEASKKAQAWLRRWAAGSALPKEVGFLVFYSAG